MMPPFNFRGLMRAPKNVQRVLTHDCPYEEATRLKNEPIVRLGLLFPKMNRCALEYLYLQTFFFLKAIRTSAAVCFVLIVDETAWLSETSYTTNPFLTNLISHLKIP